MEIINILAMVGTIINDILALLSALGSFIMLLGSFGKASWRKYGQIADWSILGLVLGWGLQICMAITKTTPEQIGMIFRMPTLMVYALLSISLLMVIGRMIIRRMLRSGK
ncbi:MAG: hypothetical protein IPG80_10870 [Anaerolineales bacterium]|uniref:hypothetical protein n=1 Tax=Candidatus Villigracilis vicinus TaxID=3140679 RepID=UPI0031355F98|nr:hypothetical protein [Anaerolineales bacterium]MBK7449106.1 hypothetical protein [Anaerolineales bacterium]MBK9781237.1 hypothetical protein [Anaerolineales bacterium]